MFDSFNRHIHYLRVSVTDKCNLRCSYCMPVEGVPPLQHGDLLSFEEIREVVRIAVGMGVDKVRITGGEPLVRRGIVTLVEMLSALPGIRDFAMTTNGIALDRFAEPLAKAGLHRVNISLDAIESAAYARITRGGDVRAALAGIEAARRAGLLPIKLNCVVKESPEEPDAQDVARFAKEEGLEVRFIRRMNLATGKFAQVIGGAGGDCPRCNRLRLTCNGLIRPCLFSDISYGVREFGAREALVNALKHKPESGQCSNGMIHAIGG